MRTKVGVLVIVLVLMSSSAVAFIDRDFLSNFDVFNNDADADESNGEPDAVNDTDENETDTDDVNDTDEIGDDFNVTAPPGDPDEHYDERASTEEVLPHEHVEPSQERVTEHTYIVFTVDGNTAQAEIYHEETGIADEYIDIDEVVLRNGELIVRYTHITPHPCFDAMPADPPHSPSDAVQFDNPSEDTNEYYIWFERTIEHMGANDCHSDTLTFSGEEEV